MSFLLKVRIYPSGFSTVAAADTSTAKVLTHSQQPRLGRTVICGRRASGLPFEFVLETMPSFVGCYAPIGAKESGEERESCSVPVCRRPPSPQRKVQKLGGELPVVGLLACLVAVGQD